MNASDDLADLFCHSSVDGHISMDEDEDDFDVAAIGRVDDAASFQRPQKLSRQSSRHWMCQGLLLNKVRIFSVLDATCFQHD